MTSRRRFFGLLAAAPLVAPALVKEMATQSTLPASPYFDPTWLSTGLDHGYIPLPRYGQPDAVYSGKGWRWTCRTDDEGLQSWEYVQTEETPNRLYGAQINSDGDAT